MDDGYTTENLASLLHRWFEGEMDAEDQVATDLVRVETYEQSGVLTKDQGFVLTMCDGSEFQMTLVQSRNAR